MSKERELLRRALDDYDNGLSHQSYFEEIRAYLAAEEGKEGGEPVAFAEYDPHGNLCALLLCSGAGLTKEEIEYGWKLEPLFLHPAPSAEKREPLTTEEMENEYWDHIEWTSWTTLIAGVRFAEKHHGIGGGDE